MPHVSRRSIDQKVIGELEKRILSFLGDTSGKSRQRIFKELLTKTERLMIAKRLSILFLLQKDVSHYAIGKTLGVSLSTVARLENRLEAGAYTHTHKWISNRGNASAVGKVLLELLALPFVAQRKPLSQLIKDY